MLVLVTVSIIIALGALFISFVSLLTKRPIVSVIEAKINKSPHLNEIAMLLVISNSGALPANRVKISAKLFTEEKKNLAFKLLPNFKIHIPKEDDLSILPQSIIRQSLLLATDETPNIVGSPLVRVVIHIEYKYNWFIPAKYLPFSYYTKQYFIFNWDGSHDLLLGDREKKKELILAYSQAK